MRRVGLMMISLYISATRLVLNMAAGLAADTYWKKRTSLAPSLTNIFLGSSNRSLPLGPVIAGKGALRWVTTTYKVREKSVHSRRTM